MAEGSHARRTTTDLDILNSGVTLPNGKVVPNRLVKAAMEEGIGVGGGLPDSRHRRLYRKWGEGGWGMIITGNVQVDPRHLATPHDRTIPTSDPLALQAWTHLHHSLSTHLPPDTSPPLALVQISHAGLQSSSTGNLSRPPWVRAIAPCEARPDTGSSIMGWVLGRVLWPVVSRRVRGEGEWLEIVGRFVEAARMVQEAGWEGVQVHSAHGYLLAEYLSPLTNPDPYPLPNVPDSVPLRLHLLYLILTGINQTTSKHFIKAVKVNCSDFVQGGLDEAQAADVVKEIVSWKLVDILEISGGNYSSPAFATFESITSPSSPSRHSLFAHFTASLLPHLPAPPSGPAILLTGGLHSRPLIADAVRSRACDLAGIGRPACVKPALPRDVLLNERVSAENTNVGGYTIPGGERARRLLGGGSASLHVSMAGEGPTAATYLETETEAEGPREEDPLLQRREDKCRKENAGDGGVPLIGAGVSTYWHECQLSRIGRGLEPDMSLGWFSGMWTEAIWWGVLKGGFFWRRGGDI